MEDKLLDNKVSPVEARFEIGVDTVGSKYPGGSEHTMVSHDTPSCLRHKLEGRVRAEINKDKLHVASFFLSTRIDRMILFSSRESRIKPN